MNTKTWPALVQPSKEEILSDSAPNYTRLPFELLDNLFSAPEKSNPTSPDTNTFETTPDTHAHTDPTQSVLDKLAHAFTSDSANDAEHLARVRKGIQSIQAQSAQAHKEYTQHEEDRLKQFQEMQDRWHQQPSQSIPEPQGRASRGFGAKRKKSVELPTLENKPQHSKG